MIFTIRFKNQKTGRVYSLNCIAPDFSTCLEKISSIYGKNLVSITWEKFKNEEAMPDAISEKIQAQ